MFTLELDNDGGKLIAYLGGEIDHHTARDIRHEIDNRLKEEGASELVLDFSSVSFMDSSGIGLILGRVEVCESLNIPLRVRGHTGVIARLIKMSAVARLKNVTVE